MTPPKESGTIKIQKGDLVVFDEKFNTRKDLMRLLFAMNNKPFVITVNFDVDDKPELDKNIILQVCANLFGVAKAQIKSGSCIPNVVSARIFYWRIIRTHGATFEECAEDTGHLSCRSVMAAIARLKKKIEESEELAEKWESVKYLCADKTRTHKISKQN